MGPNASDETAVNLSFSDAFGTTLREGTCVYLLKVKISGVALRQILAVQTLSVDSSTGVGSDISES